MTSPVGETHLRTLLASMQPRLTPGVYVFCTFSSGAPLPEGINPVCQFREMEGTTLIVEKAEADHAHISYQFPCRQITLSIHSSLTAVGFLAVVARTLADEGISLNAVSAYYHDHLFVPDDRAEDAMNCLRQLVQQALSHSQA